MTEPEWDAIIEDVVKGLWPRWDFPPIKAGQLYRMLQYFTGQRVRVAIEQYWREHPDEAWPRKLWESVHAECRKGNDDEADDEDEHGFGRAERRNIIRELRRVRPGNDKRLAKDPRKLADVSDMGDHDLYAAWLRQEGYVRT